MRFGTAVFVYAMNKDSYAGLPDDLKAVIDDNSGRNLAEKIGQVWNDIEGPGRQAAIDRGNEMITLSDEELARFQEATAPVRDRWMEEVGAAGIDGQALYDAAIAAVAAHSGS